MYIKKMETTKNESCKTRRRKVAQVFVYLFMYICICGCVWEGVSVFLLVY